MDRVPLFTRRLGIPWRIPSTAQLSGSIWQHIWHTWHLNAPDLFLYLLKQQTTDIQFLVSTCFFWWITCWLLWFCISPPDWDWGPRPLNVQAYLEQPLGFEPLMEAQRPFETVPEDDLPPSSEIPEANDATDLKEQRIDDDWSSRLLASLCRQESLCCTKREIFRSSEEASTSARNTDKRCPSWKIMGDHHLAKNHGTCSCVT